MFWIGIDPGASGGIAVISDNWDVGEAEVYKMPETELDLYNLLVDIKTMIHNHGDNNDLFCLIEAVHSFPGQGVVSSFKFGFHYGLEIMAILALQISFDKVTPQKWMRSFTSLKRKDMTNSKWKNHLKQKAQQFYPKVKLTLATTDALLLAHYNRHFYNKT